MGGGVGWDVFSTGNRGIAKRTYAGNNVRGNRRGGRWGEKMVEVE